MAFYLSMGVSLAVEDAVSLATVLDMACPINDELVDYTRLKAALQAFQHARMERVKDIQDASLHAGNMAHIGEGNVRQKLYEALRTDGVDDSDASDVTLATQGVTYGLADQRVRDWCYGHDTVKYMKECYESMV